MTPGVEVKSYWGSDAAAMDGSFNLAGIKDPVVDALITKMVEAKSRGRVGDGRRAPSTACCAPDTIGCRNGIRPEHNVAFWDEFSRPDVKPKYDEGVIETWWYDADKAAKLKKN